MMRAALCLGLALAIALALHRAPMAQPRDMDALPDDDAFGMLADPGFRVIPLHEAAKIAGQRFRGRLIAARLAPPHQDEHARGVELVHELRLMTKRRNVLLIRLDARTGDFLEVAGAGLTEARRRDGDSE
ncbi:hypothetical protein SAMN06265221_103154 [Paracoccus laeviglucosivorans]|uniref:Peptidase propeptide and YPEB domain-containing protein n=2 Tax=Paracoccus laeviglucosivorans TaxID=1197861 RepID=A0A521BX19_9RHOB|nr:hypothetical protein SAMN06265221_103154 [Paracoccus laeviglucosivorans]